MGLIGMIVGGIYDANKAIKQNKAKNDDSTEKITVEGRYSIEVPSFLSPTKLLSEDAAIQYRSNTLDISFMVIDEPKADFVKEIEEFDKDMHVFGNEETLLDKMVVVSLNNMFDMDKVEILEYTSTKINGMNAVTFNSFKKRTFFEDAQYGSFAFIEGRNTLYQIIILSGGTSISKLAGKLEKSINSFCEL